MEMLQTILRQSQLWIWRGRSGHLYPHHIFPTSAVPNLTMSCNYILVRRRDRNIREAVHIGSTPDLGKIQQYDPLVSRAVSAGATEIDLHFLGISDVYRVGIENDIKRGNRSLLEVQPLGGIGCVPRTWSIGPQMSWSFWTDGGVVSSGWQPVEAGWTNCGGVLSHNSAGEPIASLDTVLGGVAGRRWAIGQC
jgi:hypothetical protein